MYKILNEEDVDPFQRQFILIAWFSNNYVQDILLPEIDNSIEKHKNNILKNNNFQETINFYKKIKHKENCLYCYHLYAYADIVLPKKYEVIGLYNDSFSSGIQRETVIFCEVEVLVCFNKFRLFPMGETSHGHSDFCFVNFPNGIPNIVYELIEIKDKKPIRDKKWLFLCSRETYDLM